jgi:hypothetical protein
MAVRIDALGSMKFLAVSTFNAEGLELYGRRMMKSFRGHWPEEVQFVVYSEGWDGSLDLLSAAPWLPRFKVRHASRRFRDFRWDAVRFSHKVAAVCHAARSDADVLIWMDGDIVTHSPIALADLERLAPKGDEWIAWLDRVGLYPECGFYMLNCRHPRHAELVDAFQGMYEDDKLFSLPEWTDCHVLEHIVKSTGVGIKSLSETGRRTSHPLVNGPLGAWLDHLKGPRKQEGKSRKTDMQVRRKEAYWQ